MVSRRLASTPSRRAIEAWRLRLTSEEIRRIRDGVGHLGGEFYDDEDGELRDVRARDRRAV